MNPARKRNTDAERQSLITDSLVKEFRRIRKEHRTALVVRASREVLGASVIRVFAEGTRDILLPKLAAIDFESLHNIRNQEMFSEWFDEHVGWIWQTIKPLNNDRSSIAPGGKWGHSTKIMALFVRSIVLCSRFFSDREVKRVSPFLYVPIDSVIMRRLTKMGVSLPFRRIREINTRKRFYLVQTLLGEAAFREGVPRIWFDDNWASAKK